MALAHSLREFGSRILFVARASDFDTRGEVVRRGFEAATLHASAVLGVVPICEGEPRHAGWAGVQWQQDASETASVLADWKPDWVVVDHYSFDALWHRHVIEALGSRVAVIDDLADRELCASLLIDHNLSRDHRRKYAGRIEAGIRILGGPRFALVGPRYADGSVHVPSGTVRSIGIFMGGVDRPDFSQLAWKACREVAGHRGPITIVTTCANPNLARLESATSNDSSTEIRTDLPDLHDFHVAHDLQIGAGGGAIWERCCVGAPTLVLVAAENQRAGVAELVEHGAVAGLAPGVEPTVESVGAAIAGLISAPEQLAQFSASARSLVDGLGARRVALALLASRLRVRLAKSEDAALIHQWRNHPSTRSVSRNPDAISFERHLEWLRKVLDDDDRRLFIGEVAGRSVGVVRFDRAGSDIEVSIFLDPCWYGLGLGPAMLAAAEEEVARALPGGGRFAATVLEHNDGSRRLFESAGYIFSGETGYKEALGLKGDNSI